MCEKRREIDVFAVSWSGASTPSRAWTAAACDRTHRAKPHTSFARRPQTNTPFWRVHEALRAGIAVAISRRVTVRTSQRGSPNGDCRVDDDVRGDGYARAHKVCAVSGAKCSGGLCDVAGRAVCCPRKRRPTDCTCCTRSRRWTWLTLRALGLAGAEHPGAETDRSETVWVLHRRIERHQSHKLTFRFGRQSF